MRRRLEWPERATRERMLRPNLNQPQAKNGQLVGRKTTKGRRELICDTRSVMCVDDVRRPRPNRGEARALRELQIRRDALAVRQVDVRAHRAPRALTEAQEIERMAMLDSVCAQIDFVNEHRVIGHDLGHDTKQSGQIADVLEHRA